MPTESDTKSTFYTWSPPGVSTTVHLEFSVVDRLLLEVMKGFGAVPKRGAEVGGILLGAVKEIDGRRVVHVFDYAVVACSHASGPSYVLSEAEREELRNLVEVHAAGGEADLVPVGYFRSHTRDGVQLAEEDLEILDASFPGEDAIALLVKPYATRLSQAGIFLREDGRFAIAPSAQEFPFRRKELGGGSSTLERQAAAARFGQSAAGEDVNPYLDVRAPATLPAEDGNDVPPPNFGTNSMEEKKGKGIRSGWMWIPLSFIFMLLGTVLGFQIALSMRPKQPANPYLEAWNLSLSVRKSGSELQVSWDPLAPAIRNSTRGVLHLDSREETRAIDLNASQLRAGSLIYKSLPERVVLRLDVYPRERSSVSETAEYKAGN